MTIRVQSETYFRALCDRVGIALLACDRDLRVTYLNEAAQRLLDADPDRVTGAPAGSLMPWAHRANGEMVIREVIESGRTRHLQWDYRDTSGRPVELLIAVAPVVSVDGARQGASLCLWDITHRITQQDQWHEGRKMTSLGEMAGAVAHHFNNVLGGVVTGIDYANSCQDPALDRRVLVQAGRSLTKAMSIVKGLLAFAEGDRSAVDWADLTETINEVAEETERLVADRGITFRLDLRNCPVWPVRREPLLTILRNVIQNAIDAMPDGGLLTINVETSRDQATINIVDTGVGLSDEARTRVFEPFWTTKGVLGEGIGGSTGLGLAIAHGLITMIGGTISVSSAPQQGSCFTLTLPRCDGQ